MILALKVAVTLALHLLVTVPLAALVLRVLRPSPGVRALAWTAVLLGALLSSRSPGSAGVRPLEELVGPGVLAVGAGGPPVLLQASLELRQVPLTGGDVVASLLGPVWAPVTGGLLMLLGLLGLARLVLEHRALAREVSRLPVALQWNGLPVVSGEPGPMAFGGRLVLPEAVRRSLSPEELRAVLAHEEAHVRRGDPLCLLALTALERLMPPLRMATRPLRQAIEECADARALGQASRRDLAEALLKSASLPLSCAPALGACGLRQRLEALYRRPAGLPASLAAAALAAAVALGTRIF